MGLTIHAKIIGGGRPLLPGRASTRWELNPLTPVPAYSLRSKPISPVQV